MAVFIILCGVQIFFQFRSNFNFNSIQFNSISDFKIFLQKYAYLVQICLKIQKIPFIFMCDNYKCQELHVK